MLRVFTLFGCLIGHYDCGTMGRAARLVNPLGAAKNKEGITMAKVISSVDVVAASVAITENILPYEDLDEIAKDVVTLFEEYGDKVSAENVAAILELLLNTYEIEVVPVIE